MPSLRDGTFAFDPRLDRLVQFDEASRDYPVRTMTQAKPVITKRWSIPVREPVLDQHAEGACVGYGITNDLRFRPVPVADLDGTFARTRIYHPAQRVDPWPGGSYPGATPVYEGTSVLAGMKVAVAEGFYGQYRWAFSEEDLALGVGHVGPAILGLIWKEGMAEPDKGGYLRPVGQTLGGHCLIASGINAHSGYYTVYNSWGPDWGRRGTAKIRRTDMADLLAQQGEACIPVQRYDPTTA